MKPKKKLIVRSQKDAVRVLKNRDIVKNWNKSLRVKPRHKGAVLLPCSATKPFHTSPSHKGYIKALQGKNIDAYIVSEPLGIIPYSWGDTYPNNAYDFPPKYLKGEARDILIDRFARWFEKVAPKYKRIYAPLPAHHGKLIDIASGDIPVIDLSISRYRDETGDTKTFRATGHGYVRWLRKKIRPPSR